MTRIGIMLLWCAAAGAGPGLSAQTLADQVAGVEDGQVRFDFPARSGICGGGENSYTERRTDQADWESDCEGGPVRVAITRVGGEATSVRWYLGGRWLPSRSSTHHLGSIVALDAARFLVGVFATHDDKMGRNALTAAGLADADQIWPSVMDVARESDRSTKSRRAALTWLARSAGRRLETEGQQEENSVRQQAIFALSQLPKEESVPRLVRIVETHKEASTRRQALFWLGQTGDARALPVIERILRTPRP